MSARSGVVSSYYQVHAIRMTAVRKTISLPASVAKRLEREARRRNQSFSALVTELVQRKPEKLPYAGLIDDDEELSHKVEELLARASH